MSNKDKHRDKKNNPRDWGIYIIIIIGVIFMFSAILYVINSEKPIETLPPTTLPPTTPPVTTTLPPTTLPPTTPPETKSKIKWVKNSIEAEMGEYATDNRIGVKVLNVYNSINTASTAIEVLFENRTDVSQPFDLKKIYLFDKGGEKYKVQWTHLIMISFEADNFESIKEIPPKNGLRVIFHFNRLRRLPDYITFESYYYEDLESTEWKIKVRY